MVYKFFDKKSAGSGVNMHVNNNIKQNQQPLDLATYHLAKELHKPIIKKILKSIVYSRLNATDFVSFHLEHRQY